MRLIRKPSLKPIAAVLASLVLAACGTDSVNNSNAQLRTDAAGGSMNTDDAIFTSNALNPDFADAMRVYTNPACDEDGKATREGGGAFDVTLNSASGFPIRFTVFEPANFDCSLGNPVVLHSHGYGGSRQPAADGPSGNNARLVNAGAGVISIDQRGFGESGGTVRVLDPDFEGKDLLQILDWAEANLDWLRYRNDGSPDGREFNMVAGSTGGSYGGGYQLLIHNIDPLARLDALTPDITWNDLRYSLNPGAVYGVKDYDPGEDQIAALGTVKSGWALALVAGGEAGAAMNDGQDTQIRETLLRGAASNNFPAPGLEFFRYHSPSYFCDPEIAGDQAFLSGANEPTVPQQTPRPVDILFTQGFRDTLFNFNDALHNFVCYRNLTDSEGNKGDVRLMTHQSGHILGVSSQGMEPFESIAAEGGNFPEFQTAGGAAACGDTSLADAQYAFLVQKLFKKNEQMALLQGAEDAVAAAFQSLDDHKGQVCLSHDDTTGEAVFVDEEEFLANQAPAAKGLHTVSIAPAAEFGVGEDGPLMVTSGPVGLVGYLPQPTMAPIEVPAGLTTLAGIPTATVTIAPVIDGVANPACSPLQDGVSNSPTGILGLDPACDPIVYVGLGVERDGAWRLIDSQVVPVRGYGKRHVELTGVAEQLREGENISLMVYGYHPQYAATSSRDLFSGLVAVSGEVKLPWVDQ